MGLHKDKKEEGNGEEEVRGNNVVAVDQTQWKVQMEAADSERMERVMGTQMNGGRRSK